MSMQSEMSKSVANLYFAGSTGQQQNPVQRPAQGFAQQPKGKVLCEWRGTEICFFETLLINNTGDTVLCIIYSK